MESDIQQPSSTVHCESQAAAGVHAGTIEEALASNVQPQQQVLDRNSVKEWLALLSDDCVSSSHTFAIPQLKEWNAAFDYLQDQAYKALDYLSYERGIVGAQMNRVEFINTNLRSQSLNTEKSKSDLIDTDVAASSTRFIQQQAQLEVSTRMVKEANSLVNPIKVLMRLWDDIKAK
jgi:flagellin-like hook-associated protein FlgL